MKRWAKWYGWTYFSRSVNVEPAVEIGFVVFSLVARDCADVYRSGRHKSGIYTIEPDGEGEMEVFCDQVSMVRCS